MTEIVKAGDLLPMDKACLQYLVESGGQVPTIAIPERIFGGAIPSGHPSLVDLGLVENIGDNTLVTTAGRSALARFRDLHGGE